MKHKNIFLNTKILVIVSLFIAVFLCYAFTLNAPFVIDDKDGIVNNALLRDFRTIFQHRLAILGWVPYYTSFAIGGLNPAFFRIVNILFHFGNAVVIYFLVKKMINQRTGYIAALLFALHPIFIESVVWISALSYVKYSFFFLLSVLWYIYGKENKRWYYASIGMGVLSILSSEKAVALPLVLAGLEICFYSLKKNWKRILPYAITIFGVALMLVTNIGTRVQSFEKDYYIQSQFYNPIEHIPYAITYYAQLMVFPRDLTVYHSELSISIIEFMLRWLVFILLIVIPVIYFKKNKHFLFWMGFFFATIGPTLIPLNVVWVVAERYAYLGAIGVLVMVAMVFNYLLGRKKLQTFGYAVLLLVIVALFGRTVVRNTDWLSEANLWSSTVKVSPSSSNAHNNMGDVYARQKNYQMAAEEFRRAIELQPGDADPRHNLGIAYTVLGKYQEAVEAYRSALAIDPMIVSAHQNLGVIYYQLKMYTDAEYHLTRAIQLGVKNPRVNALLEEVRSLK